MKDIVNCNSDFDYEMLIHQVGETLKKGKAKVATAVKNEIVQTYWKIGKQIVEYEQKGQIKAEYGSEVLNRLSRDLTLRYGKGFSRSNIVYIRKLYLVYQKGQTLSDQLSWSHYVELLKIEDDMERSFYEKEAIHEKWGVRELKRQMQSMLFHRIALSSNKNEVMKLAREGQIIEKPEDVLKEPYVFEFTGLPELPVYREGDLEEALVNNLSQFFLELGKGFTFVSRQQKMVISGRTYKVDLVFYHRILKCFVLIDLKRGEVQHEDIGQMNFYLNYYREEMNTEGDTEPIGIVLGAYQDKVVMQYALQNISNQIFVSRYQLYLPEREQLEAELKRFMGSTEEGADESINNNGELERKEIEEISTKTKDMTYDDIMKDTEGVSEVREAAVDYGIHRQGFYTTEDYYALPDEQRVELIDGYFYDMAAPNIMHQEIVGAIYKQISNYIDKHKGACKTYMAPVDVKLDCDNRTMVQPDVLILCDKDKIRQWGIMGVPDFVLEVVSPSTKKKDYTVKVGKYMYAGVREYWLLDPYKKVLVTYDFEHASSTMIHDLQEPVPVRIYDGKLCIDFTDILRMIAEFSTFGTDGKEN